MKQKNALENGMTEVKNSTIKPIDAPSYGFWSALYMSFYSRRLYVDVGKYWKGFGIRYLMFVLLLWCIPMTVKMIYAFNAYYDSHVTDLLRTIPTIYIQNGDATTDKPMPYMKMDAKGQVVLIVDTTNKIHDFPVQYPHLVILINRDKIAIKMPQPKLLGSPDDAPNTSQPMVQYFKKSDSGVLSGESLVSQKVFYQWKYGAEALIYPIFYPVFLGLFLGVFLIFGAMGVPFSLAIFSFQITWKQSSRVIMVAATPVLFVLSCLLVSNHTFAGYGFVLIGILAVYFSHGIYAIKSESKRIART